jgi:hypothetical protein
MVHLVGFTIEIQYEREIRFNSYGRILSCKLDSFRPPVYAQTMY